LLDSGTRRAQFTTVATAADVLEVIHARGAAIVALDSPLQPSHLLLRDPAMRRRYGVPDRRGMNGPLYANYRVCDFELIRRGMPLYQVAATREAAAGWMRVGFDLADTLRAAGMHPPRTEQDHAAGLLEVFPDAAFVTLLGGRPEPKSGPRAATGLAQRRRALEAAGISLDGGLSHDELDAAAAALTALRWWEGQGCAVGDPAEGLIVLPVPGAALRDRYQRLAAPM